MIGKNIRFALVHCPHCKALYQVIKVEAPETEDQQISCRSCHKLLAGREWRYVVKYFQLKTRVIPAARRGPANVVLGYCGQVGCMALLSSPTALEGLPYSIAAMVIDNL